MKSLGSSMHSRLYRLGRFAATHPWRITAGWMIGIAMIGALYVGFGKGTTDNPGFRSWW